MEPNVQSALGDVCSEFKSALSLLERDVELACKNTNDDRLPARLERSVPDMNDARDHACDGWYWPALRGEDLRCVQLRFGQQRSWTFRQSLG